MMNREFAARSDLLQLLVVFPTKLILLLISTSLVFPPLLSESLFLALSAFALAAMLINGAAGQFRLRSLFVGGDLLLWLFCAIALWGGTDGASAWQTLASLKWLFFLYFLSYSFDLFPTINSRIFSLTLSASLVAVFAILQTQIDTGRLLSLFWQSSSPSPFPHLIPYSAQGLLKKTDLFGFLMAMLLSFPAAIFAVHYRLSRRLRLLVLLSMVSIITAVLLTFQTMAWALLGAMFVSLFFIIRRTGLLILTAALIAASPYLLSKIDGGSVEETLSSHQTISETDRRLILRATLKMFKEAPWFGIGYNQNKDRLTQFLEQPISSEPIQTPNTYFQLPASTGIFGLLAFMGFALMFLFSTLRLWQEIPKTHLWHRSFAVGSLSCQVVFHGAGLFVWTLQESTLVYPFIFALATSSLLTRRYAQGIVPDDYSA